MENKISKENEISYYDKLKKMNLNLIQQISELKKEIYDLKNLHVELVIKEEEDEFSDEEYAIKQAYLRDLWDNRDKDMSSFCITDNMDNLEREKRATALKILKTELDDYDDEISEVQINDDIYYTNGKFIVQKQGEEGFGKILGYIKSSEDEITEENVIFFN